jgi:DNA-binding Lrp family transcriptional regulator
VPEPTPATDRTWTFLSNHGHVLVALSRDPSARLRDIADTVGITERATQAIVRDLEEGGYVTKVKVGRRNEYRLHPHRRLRHPAESDTPIKALLGIFD